MEKHRFFILDVLSTRSNYLNGKRLATSAWYASEESSTKLLSTIRMKFRIIPVTLLDDLKRHSTFQNNTVVTQRNIRNVPSDLVTAREILSLRSMFIEKTFNIYFTLARKSRGYRARVNTVRSLDRKNYPHLTMCLSRHTTLGVRTRSERDRENRN